MFNDTYGTQNSFIVDMCLLIFTICLVTLFIFGLYLLVKDNNINLARVTQYKEQCISLCYPNTYSYYRIIDNKVSCICNAKEIVKELPVEKK